MIPNQSGAIYGPTAGISRNMQVVSPRAGGNLNGTASTVILFSHAGTPGSQLGVPRQGNPNFGIPSPAPRGWQWAGRWPELADAERIHAERQSAAQFDPLAKAEPGAFRS